MLIEIEMEMISIYMKNMKIIHKIDLYIVPQTKMFFNRPTQVKKEKYMRQTTYNL